MFFFLANYGGRAMKLRFLTEQKPKKLFCLAIYFALLATVICMIPLTTVGANDGLQDNSESSEQLIEPSVKQDDFAELTYPFSNEGNQRQQSYSVNLLCHGKGPQNKANQSKADDSNTDHKQVKREGCDIDPFSSDEQSASVEKTEKQPDFLSIALSSVIGASAGFLFIYLILKYKKKH